MLILMMILICRYPSHSVIYLRSLSLLHFSVTLSNQLFLRYAVGLPELVFASITWLSFFFSSPTTKTTNRTFISTLSDVAAKGMTLFMFGGPMLVHLLSDDFSQPEERLHIVPAVVVTTLVLLRATVWTSRSVEEEEEVEEKEE